MDTSPPYHDDLLGIVNSTQPASLLAVIPAHHPLNQSLAKTFIGEGYTVCTGHDVIAPAADIARSELAIVAHTLEFMDKRDAAVTIARLRDLYSKILYVVLPMGLQWPGLQSYWDHTDLIAFGLRLINRYAVGGRPVHLYHYDIYNYKTTPDWLNAKYWANPAMWDKSRW